MNCLHAGSSLSPSCTTLTPWYTHHAEGLVDPHHAEGLVDPNSLE
jgi:hypothetical protein